MFEFSVEDMLRTWGFEHIIGSEVWLGNGVLISFFESDGYSDHFEEATKAKKVLDELVKFGITDRLQDIKNYYENVEDIWRFENEDCFNLFITHCVMSLLDNFDSRLMFGEWGVAREMLIDSYLINLSDPTITETSGNIISSCIDYLAGLDDSPTRTEEEKQALKDMITLETAGLF